jgi:hypothetical protein
LLVFLSTLLIGNSIVPIWFGGEVDRKFELIQNLQLPSFFYFATGFFEGSDNRNTQPYTPFSRSYDKNTIGDSDSASMEQSVNRFREYRRRKPYKCDKKMFSLIWFEVLRWGHGGSLEYFLWDSCLRTSSRRLLLKSRAGVGCIGS